MKVWTAKPRRVGNHAGYFHFLHFVLITAPQPLIDTKIMVQFQCVYVAPPHSHRGMITPASSGFNSAQNLISFNSLFAEPPVIKSLYGFIKIRVGEECLHRSKDMIARNLITNADIPSIRNMRENSFFWHGAIADNTKNSAGFRAGYSDFSSFQPNIFAAT